MYSSVFPAALLATGVAIERVIRLINRIASALYACGGPCDVDSRPSWFRTSKDSHRVATDFF